MEQLINNMLANVQMPQAAPAVKKSETSDKDAFQKLLEQKQSNDTASAPQKQDRPENTQKPQEAQGTDTVEEPQQVQIVSKTGKELEDQMVLAAMAILQNPVVPVEQVAAPEVQTEAAVVETALVEAVAEEAAPLVEEAVLAPETQTLVPEVEQNTEIPVENGEGVKTVDKTLVEDIPQPIEAPEAKQEAETPEVEVKVETGEVSQEAETEDTPELQDAEVETPIFKDVEAAPVKVGEAPKAEKAEEPVETQIGTRLTEALKNGETRVELQLNPENLGKVTVEMTWSKDGGLVVQIHAENRGTQNLLEKNMSGLESLLSRETQQEVRVEVPRQEESQRQDLYEQQQNQHRQRQQEQRKNQETNSEAFMQQLRLGLIPMDEE